jgi:hypothetical protein
MAFRFAGERFAQVASAAIRDKQRMEEKDGVPYGGGIAGSFVPQSDSGDPLVRDVVRGIDGSGGFGAIVNDRKNKIGQDYAKSFVDRMESGPFALMVEEDPGTGGTA